MILFLLPLLLISCSSSQPPDSELFFAQSQEILKRVENSPFGKGNRGKIILLHLKPLVKEGGIYFLPRDDPRIGSWAVDSKLVHYYLRRSSVLLIAIEKTPFNRERLPNLWEACHKNFFMGSEYRIQKSELVGNLFYQGVFLVKGLRVSREKILDAELAALQAQDAYFNTRESYCPRIEYMLMGKIYHDMGRSMEKIPSTPNYQPVGFSSLDQLFDSLAREREEFFATDIPVSR